MIYRVYIFTSIKLAAAKVKIGMCETGYESASLVAKSRNDRR